MEKLILIKYGELTTKKDNRNQFIKTLKNNILKMLENEPVTIQYDINRMYIYSDPTHFDFIIEKLKNVFGLHRIGIAYTVDTNIERLQEQVLEILKQESFQTFKVETKRADKKYPIPSTELNRMLGAYILKNTDKKVDVHNPDVTLFVEIRENCSFAYTKEIEGIGGIPVGIEGKGLLMLSGGIDSPVAGYLALKRGVDLECIYFDSPPHTSIEAKNKVLELAHILKNYSKNIKVHIVPFTHMQETIYQTVDPTYMITIMRRMMYRIAERLAKRRNCKILINGESIGQVASQTLASMQVINEVTNMPVIRPVACFDKLEIINLSKKIKTYETSILPYEDCCTIFVPKHPVIHPALQKCIELETLFDYEALIKECLENITTIQNFEKENFKNLL